MRAVILPILAAVLLSGQLSYAGDALDDLIRERIMTSPPDRAKAQIYDQGAVMIGDLFKSRARIAIGVNTKSGEVLAFACFVHRAGDWQEIVRQPLSTAQAPHRFSDEWPCTLTDLDGDGAPELLLSESGGSDERIVSVWRYHTEQQTLTKVGSGLRNPTLQNGQVRGNWKLGPTRGDIGAEEHAWIDGRLIRTWSSAQRYPLHEYLIGSGEPAVRIEQSILSTTGGEISATVVGNVASYRNHLPAGEQPRPMTVLVQEPRGRSYISISPKNDALTSANLHNRWDELIARAVLTDPPALSSAMTVTMSDKSKVALANVATVTVTPSTIGPTYQYFPIDDEVRQTITEPPDLPAIAVSNIAAINWTRSDQAIPVWATAVVAKTPILQATDDVLVFIRLPNFSGFPLDQIESGTLVTDLKISERVVTVAITVTAGSRPTFASKDVARPLIVLNLGRLAPGLHHIKTAITGLPDNKAGNITLPFTVK